MLVCRKKNLKKNIGRDKKWWEKRREGRRGRKMERRGERQRIKISLFHYLKPSIPNILVV